MSAPIGSTAPVRFAAPLPAAADLVVIGGGVVGVCAALYAAERGLRVVLCEKGRIAAEQSSRNWGWIRQQGRDMGELPIVTEALGLWDRLAQRIGPRLGFRRTGVIYLAKAPDDIARFERWLGDAQRFGVDSRMLSQAQVAAMLPGLAAPQAGALYTPSDGRAEPAAAVPLIAGLAAEAGVAIAEDCAVRALDIAAGRVAGVVTERGRIACAQVLVAAGAWSSLLLGNHGLRLPQLAVRATVGATEPLPELFAGAVSGAGWAYRRREDGGYTVAPGSGETLFVGRDAFRALRWYLPQLRRDPLAQPLRPAAPRGFPDAWGTPRRWDADRQSPFERMRVLDPAPDLRALNAAAAGFAAAHPGLPPVRFRAAWAGMIDTLPDVVPVLDRVAALPGLWLATGMSGHGFGIGPGVGRVMADLIAGGPAGHDLTRFRLDRFAGPVRLRPGDAL
jgi:glycine/D-amino acid oxidase-like deaminating enzyme